MRTQFLYVGLLSMLAGGLVSAGCSDIHTGQLSDPSGPVKLVRITVQDAEPFGIKASVTDILDTKGSPFSTAVACDEINPCLPQFVFEGNNPNFDCLPSGFCNDPLAPTQDGVSIGVPETGDPGEAAGTQIRFVFSKLLNSSFETVTTNPNKLPGTDKTYTLAKGIVEIDGPDGMPLPQLAAYWDPAGSPSTTSDPIRSPFGPALVIKPGVVLAPEQTYTVKINSAMITDRQGNPMADQNGTVVTGIYSKTFTTEPFTVVAAISSVDLSTPGAAKVAPNQIIQIGFNSGVAEGSVVCDVKNGTTAVTVLAYSERADDPTACTAPDPGPPAKIGPPLDDLLLNIFPTNVADPVTAVPAAAWAPGDYTIDCMGKDDTFGMASFHFSGTFTVTGAPVDPADKDTGTLAIDNHVLPSQCTGM